MSYKKFTIGKIIGTILVIIIIKLGSICRPYGYYMQAYWETFYAEDCDGVMACVPDTKIVIQQRR